MATVITLHLPPTGATIADLMEAFLADQRHRRGLRDNTVAAYRCDLTTAAHILTGSLETITVAQVEAFLASRDEQTSTNNRRLTSLRRFFAWAGRQGQCIENPTMGIESKRATTRLPRPIASQVDQDALDAAIVTAPQPYRLAFTVLRETGMRADEVVGLNVGDVCLDTGREGLRVREAKNNHERIVVLDADVMKRTLRGLRAWLRSLGSVGAHIPLFRSNRGTRISYDALHYQWAQLCNRAGLVVPGTTRPQYTIHQLRHTAATRFLRDYPEHIVSRMLGHRDPRSTRQYADVNEDQVRMARPRSDRKQRSLQADGVSRHGSDHRRHWRCFRLECSNTSNPT